jgi:hypothetical protein
MNFADFRMQLKTVDFSALQMFSYESEACKKHGGGNLSQPDVIDDAISQLRAPQNALGFFEGISNLFKGDIPGDKSKQMKILDDKHVKLKSASVSSGNAIEWLKDVKLLISDKPISELQKRKIYKRLAEKKDNAKEILLGAFNEIDQLKPQGDSPIRQPKPGRDVIKIGIDSYSDEYQLALKEYVEKLAVKVNGLIDELDKPRGKQ